MQSRALTKAHHVRVVEGMCFFLRCQVRGALTCECCLDCFFEMDRIRVDSSLKSRRLRGP